MQTSIANLGTFAAGLNTEANQLTDNPQYTTDELNCQIFKDLTRARRYGMTIESDGVAVSGSTVVSDTAITYQPVWNTNALTDDLDGLKIVAKRTSSGSGSFTISEAGAYYIIAIGGGGGGQCCGKNGSLWSGGGAGAEIGVTIYLDAGSYSYTVGAGGAGGGGKGGKFKNNKQDPGKYGEDTYLKNSSGNDILRARGGTANQSKSDEVDSPGGEASVYVTILNKIRVAQGATGKDSNGKGGVGTLDARYGSGGDCLADASAKKPSESGKDGLFMIRRASKEIHEVFESPLSGMTGYYWSNYDKKGDDCIVVQQGKYLTFFKAEEPYSSHKITSIDVSGTIEDIDASKVQMAFASGEGYLLCVHDSFRPFYVTLTEDGVATATPIYIQVRDLDGLTEDIDVETQPSTLSATHKYNLLNQGWTTDKINTFHDKQNTYPSNNLQWFIGRDTSGEFSPSDLLKYHFGTTPAPKGHFIINYFIKNRAYVSEVSGIATEKETSFVTDAVFTTGRFFYLSGNTVLFSQNLLKNISNIGKCYQDADPTSEEISDIVATDGGTILFQNIGKGQGLVKFPTGLLVFGKDGVYDIASASGAGFSATDYSVDFITNAGAYNRACIVETEAEVYYWSPTGIYRVSVDEVTGTRAVANSVSLTTIQTWYNQLPKFSKENVKGVFDYVNNRIVWCYPTDENATWKLDGILKYDLSLKAFLPGKLAEGGSVIWPIKLNDPRKIEPITSIFAGDDLVYADTSAVTANAYSEEYDEQSSVTYLILVDYYGNFYFGDYTSRDFIDWESTDYDSYFVTGPVLFGDLYGKKYAPDIEIYFKRTEEGLLRDGSYVAPSGCKVQARWRWSNNDKSNRWDIEQQGYIVQPGFINFRYVNGKMRVRGNGEALQLGFKSEAGKDFRVNGITMKVRSR